jgi:hypothetical protein
MSDLVVTVPKTIWVQWIQEGDPAGEVESGEEWAYWVSGKPKIEVGERLYIVSWGKLRGYSPVVRILKKGDGGGYGICRRGGAVSCTIPEAVPGFRGWRRRWWERDAEVPYPNWRTDGIPKRQVEILFKADPAQQSPRF